MQTPLLSEFLTREQLAQELGVNLRTLSRWVAKRRGPKKVKVGSRVVYRRADVLAWLDSQVVDMQEAA